MPSVGELSAEQVGGMFVAIVTDRPLTNVDITGLNGDVDLFYDIFVFAKGASTAVLSLQPNGLDSDQDGTLVSSNAGGDPLGFNTGPLLRLGNIRAAGPTIIRATFAAARGLGQRAIVGLECGQSGGVFLGVDGCQWANDAVRVTSLRFHSSVPDAIEPGSRFIVRRGVPL